jgi:integrase/recombinase XerD
VIAATVNDLECVAQQGHTMDRGVMPERSTAEYPITGITGYPTDDGLGGATGLALARVTVPGGVVSSLRIADDLAAAFLAGYGPATREAYARDLHVWGEFLMVLGVEVLGAHRVHVDAFVRQSEDEGVAPATIARRLSALSGFYAYALDENLIARSPVARVRRPRVSDESPRLGVDRTEMRGLLDAAHASGPRDHALACLLVLNGLRVSETMAADVTDLAYERGHRTLKLRRKGSKRQTMALAPRTAAALDVMLNGRSSGALFVTRSGRRMDRHAALKVVRRLARMAGIEYVVSPHSLRHGFVTAALDAGVPLRDVQDAAGHADPRTTRRYDRGRHSLDRAATYTVASYLAA